MTQSDSPSFLLFCCCCSVFLFRVAVVVVVLVVGVVVIVVCVARVPLWENAPRHVTVCFKNAPRPPPAVSLV